MACQLCRRPIDQLTQHHLIPRQYTKRRKQDPGPTIDICLACHKQIHTLFDNVYLARELNTLEKLQQHPKMIKFIAWVHKQNPQKKIRSFRGS